MLLKKERKKEIITTEGSGDEKQMEQKQKGEGSKKAYLSDACIALTSLNGRVAWWEKKKQSFPSML